MRGEVARNDKPPHHLIPRHLIFPSPLTGGPAPFIPWQPPFAESVIGA